MNDSTRNQAIIGAFVIGAVLLAVVGVVVFGSGKLFKKVDNFVLYFEGSVKGLNIGAPVTFRGVRIGSVTGITLRANPAMIGFAVLTILLQVAAVYVPFLDEFFEVVPLSAANFGLCVALGLVVWVAAELEKRLLLRRKERQGAEQ